VSNTVNIKVPIRKMYLRIVLFTGLMYIVAFLDRVNVGFAALTMNSDLGLGAEAFGVGAGIFFIGYFAGAVPSNYLITRISPRKLLAVLSIVWSVMAFSLAFVGNVREFYVLRFLLGLAESGFYPGLVYYLTRFFPRTEAAKVIAILLCGWPVACIIGSPLSSHLMAIDWLDIAGWKWLFVLEALPALILGVVAWFYLKDDIDGLNYLTPAEKAAVKAQLREDEGGGVAATSLDLRLILFNKTVWTLALIYFLLIAGLYALTLWLPQILEQRAHSGLLGTGWLNSIPFCGAALGMWAVAKSSDRNNERCGHFFVAATVGAAVLAAAVYLDHWLTIGEILGLLAIAAFGMFGAFGPFWAVASNISSSSNRAVAIAIINCFGNVGGFAGPYLVGYFRQHLDSFEAGLLICALMMLGAGSLMLTLRGQQK